LHDRLMVAGAVLTVKTLDAVLKGDYVETPQPEIADAPHAPKIFKNDCIIHWDQAVDKVYNLILGLSPYPAAFTHLNNKMLKIYQAEKISGNAGRPGEISSDNKTFLRFSCLDGWINVKE